MINTWRMIVLGLVFSQGADLLAMDVRTEKKPESPRLSCSAELRKKTATIKIAVDITKEAKYRYYPHCGENTPPEYSKFPRNRQKDFMKDVCPFDYNQWL